MYDLDFNLLKDLFLSYRFLRILFFYPYFIIQGSYIIHIFYKLIKKFI